ncbi:MAG: hypothetical protein HYS27_27695 [Deltaproteobacteria bacterium]|nr:hypothetical protein [Deltaproteobacteria bacterium]
MRALVASAAVVGALAAVLWLLALLTSTPPLSASAFLLGEPVAVVGEPWAVRFGAAREGGTGPSSLHGTVALAGGAATDAGAGFARLPISAAGPYAVTLDVCLDDGAPCLRARSAVEATAQRREARARFTWLGKEPPVATLATVARRTSVAIRMPLELDAAAPSFTVELERAAGPLLLDVVVDGAVRDVVPANASSVDVPTPAGLRPGAVVVVHAGGPWPEDAGVWAIARVRDPAEPLGAFAARLAREAGADDDVTGPLDDEAARALVQRLRPAVLRAPRLPFELLPVERGMPWAELYLGAAALLVALVALAGRSRRMPPMALAAGVGAVAALCAGLYVVLLLVGG